ncbi:ornithine carbamoyltransferase [bacterium]|nr:ornithine carbamoyltransferase [bacterium]
MNYSDILRVKENFQGRDLLSISDISKEEVLIIFEVAKLLKDMLKRGEPHPLLQGKSIALLFEKPSTRTRVSFEVGTYQLGAYPLFLSRQDLQLGRGETIGDTARTLERYVNAIMARVFKQDTLEELAKYARIPVINGLSDKEHPCQALGDFFTLWERGELKKEMKFVFLGDGNNVCASLALLAAKLGVNFLHISPPGYELPASIRAKASTEASANGVYSLHTNNPQGGIRDANVIYTDVWVSMGQEEETEKRKSDFLPYQLNQSLLKLASPDVKVMHCLPARRGEEITDEVMDGPHSIIFDQAENRLHIQKAILALLV